MELPHDAKQFTSSGLSHVWENFFYFKLLIILFYKSKNIFLRSWFETVKQMAFLFSTQGFHNLGNLLKRKTEMFMKSI